MTAALAAAAPYVIVAAIFLGVGAALGYWTAAVDARRRNPAPRYRRVGADD